MLSNFHSCLFVRPHIALLLLDYGADIQVADFQGGNALSRACAAGRTDVVVSLHEWVHKHDTDAEMNLLRWAAEESDQAGVWEILLGQGLVDVDQIIEESNRHTALHTAAMHDNLLLVEILLAHGADLTLTDVNQNTPLHLSLLERNQDVSRILIRAGAFLDVPNRSNKIPLDLCAETMTLSGKEQRSGKEGNGRRRECGEEKQENWHGFDGPPARRHFGREGHVWRWAIDNLEVAMGVHCPRFKPHACL